MMRTREQIKSDIGRLLAELERVMVGDEEAYRKRKSVAGRKGGLSGRGTKKPRKAKADVHTNFTPEGLETP